MVTAAQTERVERTVTRAASTATDAQQLLRSAAAALRPVVPHRAAAWLVTDPDSMLFADGWVEQFDRETCAPWFHNELAEPDVHKFTTLVGGPPAVLSRTADRSRSRRWRELMRPQGFDDELRAVAEDTTGVWGTIELHRGVGEPDFSAAEAGLVGRIGPVLAAGLRRLAVERVVSVEEAAVDGPGVVTVRADGTARAVTEAGAYWLERLHAAGGGVTTEHERTALLTLAQLVLAAGAAELPRRLRLRAADGAWVTLHAAPQLGDGDVAVIVEPSRSADLAAIAARAYGLTEREREIVLAVSRGESTKQMAAAMFLSQHTVRDHVKSAMAKIGVGSRGELVATLFERHRADAFFGRVGAAT